MPRPTTGETRQLSDGTYEARITIQGRTRKGFHLPHCRLEDAARERTRVLAETAASFRRTGVMGDPDAFKLLEMIATARTPKALESALVVAAELAGGELPRKKAITVLTFAELGEQWTNGELHEKWPDHVKAKKDSDQDAGRLEKLSEADAGDGRKVGDVPIDEFTLDHAEAAMRQLPEAARRPATRRQYAQLIHRVLALAVYPCRIIDRNPLPRGFMPKVGKPPAFHYLHPDDDRRLLACKQIPLARRLLWGFLAREGCREGEATQATIESFNLKRGTFTLDENKSDDPRSWALDAGVALALRRHVEAFRADADPGDAMFLDEHGRPFDGDGTSMAAVLRCDLATAGVTKDRPELLERSEARSWFRVHDLRGTFVTLALANEKTEAWVADRTGHRSSAMINRYRRRAREAKELNLGQLAPLHVAIPELRLPRDCPTGPPRGPVSRRARRTKRERSRISAEGENRTLTMLPPADFESAASTNSATSAEVRPGKVAPEGGCAHGGRRWRVEAPRKAGRAGCLASRRSS